MSTDSYSFRLGVIEAMVVPDDHGPISQERFDGIFNSEDSQDIREAFSRLDSPDFSRNGLYLKTKTQQILVDTGEGTRGAGKMIARIEAAGIRPDTIDIVIITHFHGDHIGGLVDANGQPIFPNARIVVGREEWEYWMRKDILAGMAEQRRQFLEDSFAPYVAADKIEKVDDQQQITPDIRAVLMPGHTPGQMGLVISSEGDALLHIADAAHFPLQGHFIDRVPRFDAIPEQGIATRRSVFERAADETALLLAYHFPFPGLGRLSRKDSGFDWTPAAAQGAHQ